MASTRAQSSVSGPEPRPASGSFVGELVRAESERGDTAGRHTWRAHRLRWFRMCGDGSVRMPDCRILDGSSGTVDSVVSAIESHAGEVDMVRVG